MFSAALNGPDGRPKAVANAGTVTRATLEEILRRGGTGWCLFEFAAAGVGIESRRVHGLVYSPRFHDAGHRGATDT